MEGQGEEEEEGRDRGFIDEVARWTGDAFAGSES